MNIDSVLYNSSGGIATITLNRPDYINAFNIQMRDELFEVLKLFKDDDEASVGILCGSGSKGFCSGADITEFGTAPSQVIARSIRAERDLWGLFLEIEKPIIASLHGYVIGSGIEISLLCDIRITSSDATFTMPETSLGFIPAAAGTQTLTRFIGLNNTLDMILTRKSLDSKTALSIGLVDRVVECEDLQDESIKLANNILARDQNFVQAAKKLVSISDETVLTEGLLWEKRVFQKLQS